MTKEEITHLEFIYARLVNMHGENGNTDYMIRLYSIIQDHKNQSNAKIAYNGAN